jgi:hypothetical protein
MFRVGDKIVCIKVKNFNQEFREKYPEIVRRTTLPKVGKRYTVRGFHHYEDNDYISITLNEIRNSMEGLHIEIHFPIDWFEKEGVLSIKKKELEESICLN